MPQVLTMTQLPDESMEDFAARISAQVNTFFGQSTEAGPESTGETSPEPSAPTDVSADKEPAPSS